MRRGFVAAVVATLVVGFASFFGGHWWAQYDAKRNAGAALLMQASAQDAEALFIARKALANLDDGKPSDARVVLVRYAKLRAGALSDCSRSPQCSARVGPFMPTQGELAGIASLKEQP